MKHISIAVLALTATLFSATAVFGQSQSLDFSKMSADELQELFQENPEMPKIYQASHGQDIDLTTISLQKGEMVEEYWSLRNYTGLRLSFEGGGSADMVLNSTDGIKPAFGGSASIGLGYVRRRWGFDAFVGLSSIGNKANRLGFYNLSIQPYATPFRWGHELNRLDLGAIIGVQQAAATAFRTFEKEEIWGAGGRTTTNPRAELGAFLKYQHRFFMTGSAIGIKVSAEFFNASTSFSEYFENGTTGEVLLDEKVNVKDNHLLVKVTLTYDFVLGKKKSNY